jgi:peptide-methionine (S)-S-oxide reductase
MNQYETIVFGGGCFWCTEAVFKMLKGVVSVTSGYAGGHGHVARYEEVSSGKTGHAEVVKIEYDPAHILLKTLLTVFFATHDPTTPNRQGHDVGPQYRSIILYTTDAQKKDSEDFIRNLNASNKDGAQVVTEVKPLERFFDAEDYHRDYYEKNTDAAYCQIVINPKLQKVQQEFAQLLKEVK